jgi:Carboxypeptidase regulatory-like domain
MKTKFIRQIMVVCLFFFGMSQAQWAQLKEVQLKGKATNLEGQKLGGVSILLKNISSGKNWKAVSGADGGYSFSSLPPGRYELQTTST